MIIYTIGFTKKKASDFFGILKKHGIKRLIDIRLNNSSQLAGFTKRDDLIFFLKELCDAEYLHNILLAPTKEILIEYKKNPRDWETYERNFKNLMSRRRIEKKITREIFEVPTVLLCSEPSPRHCHRRLVAEYLKNKWGDLDIINL